MSNKQTIMQLANEVIRYLNACADEAFVESVLECINDGVEFGECGNAESSESYYCRYCGAKMDL